MKKLKMLIGILLITILAGLISNTVWCQSLKIRIENKTAQIESNKEAIIQIQHTKEQLHNAANALRMDYTCDETLVSTLGIKWSELNVEEQELGEKIIQLEKELEELRGKYLGCFQLTAYCITGRTASGTYTTANRTIAVDPKIIPLGSTVYIKGYGTYIAEDTGGVVKGNIIDIYTPGYQNCVNFGRRKADVYLVN